MSYYDRPTFWDGLEAFVARAEFETVVRISAEGSYSIAEEVVAPEVIFTPTRNPIGYTIEAHYPPDKQQWDCTPYESSNTCTGWVLASHLEDMIADIRYTNSYVEFALCVVTDPDDLDANIGWAFVCRPVDPS